jgi:hypothetical protein
MFDNLNYDLMVAARLTAFRDHKRWAIVIEELLLKYQGDGIGVHVSVYGNALPPPAPNYYSPGFAGVLTPVDNRSIPSPPATQADVRVRGRIIHLDGLSSREPLAEVVVRLARQHRQELFATDAELRRWVPADMPRLLTLDEWRHPDGGELPSRTEAFQLLAQALVAGDASLYRPTEKPNTSWEHWQPHYRDRVGRLP